MCPPGAGGQAPGCCRGGGGQTTLALRRVREWPFRSRDRRRAHTGATRLHWGQNHVRNTHRHPRTGRRPPRPCHPVFTLRGGRQVSGESPPAAHPSALSLKIPDTPGNLIKHPPPGFGIRYTQQLPAPRGRRGLGQCVHTHTHTHISAHELCFLTDTGNVPVTTFPSVTVWLVVQPGQDNVRTVAAHFALYTWGWEPKQPADGVWAPEKRQGGGLGSQAGPLSLRVVALSWVTDAKRTGLAS